MTEMDFDELDKAVNSLMGGVKQSQRDKDEPTTLTISSTLAVDEKPSYEKIEKVAKKIGNETIDFTVTEGSNETVVEVPATISQRSGRFMDVMHSSSDMRPTVMPPRTSAIRSSVFNDSTVPVATNAAPVIEDAASVDMSPQVDAPAAETATDESVSDAQSQTPVESEIPTVLADTTTDTEPVVDDGTSAAHDESLDAATAVDESTDGQALAVSSADEVKSEVEPQTSPFLPDAKVEKRPLGGADTAAGEATQSQPIDSLSPTVEASPVPTATEDIPAEYHDQLVAIEAGETTSAVASPSPQPAVEATTPVADTSPIYDIDNYHQPLNHPAKKPSGWLWIILIIVIVAICGGVAAAFYLLTS